MDDLIKYKIMDETNNIDWYKKTYQSLINRAKIRNWKKDSCDVYLEYHHIIPKCLGGTDEEDNIVSLTFREHLVAHKLLIRMYPNVSGLRLAVHFMITVLKGGKRQKLVYINSNGKKRNFTSRELEEYRSGVISRNKELKTGTKASEETKKKLSKIRKGKKRRNSTREAISKGRRGIEFSEEHKKKLSESGKQKHLSKESRQKISGENSLKSRRVIDPKGQIFTSARECAKHYKVTENTVTSKWMKDPKRGFKYLDLPFSGYKVQGPDGTIYDSLSKAGKLIGRAKSTIKRWIEKYPELGWKYYKED